MEIGAETQERLDKILKLPKGARIGILAGIGVLICTGYYFAFFQGSAQELAQLRTEESKLQRRLSEVRLIAGNIVAFEMEIEGLSPAIKSTSGLGICPRKCRAKLDRLST